jgi:hypothetical protein
MLACLVLLEGTSFFQAGRDMRPVLAAELEGLGVIMGAV